MGDKQRGILFVVIATTLFGIIPSIGKITYSMGNNGIQLAFLRHLFVIPIFLILVKHSKYSLTLTRTQAIDVVKASLGSALTIICLYVSYAYIDVGSATVLHFLNPLFVCLLNFILFHQLLNKKQLLCLMCAIVGVFCFIEKSSASLIGFGLAVSSGIFFAYYMVCVEHTAVKDLHKYVFNFYLVSINAVVIFVLAIVTKSLHILPLSGYVLSFVVSLLSSLIAVVFLQMGIRDLGASLASILSTLEPLTSLCVGFLFLGETLTLLKVIGCVLIMVSTVILVKSQS